MRNHPVRRAACLVAVGGVLALVAAAGGRAVAAEATVGLGTASSFSVLASSTVTNTGPTTIGGDLGVSPGTAITNFPPGVVNGSIHSADAVAGQAMADATAAYDDAAGRVPTANVAVELGGRTLKAGVYRGAELGLTGTLTLDGENNPDGVFIFQGTSTLTTASDSQVLLINGANPCNVFWQIASSATLGTRTAFVGTILAKVTISAGNRATVAGRLFALTGAVNLDTNVVTDQRCPVLPAVTTTTSTVVSTTSTMATTTTTSTVASTTSTAPTTSSTVPTTTSTLPATTSTVAATTTTTSTLAGGGAGGGAEAGGGAGGGSARGSLARTGSQAEPLTAGGVLALVLGGLMLLASRRPRTGNHFPR